MRFFSSAFLLSLFCFHPLFADSRPNIEISTDYFTGITLDRPVSGPFFSYTPIHFSGTVSDPTISQLLFQVYFDEAEDIDSCERFNFYTVPVRDQRFSHTLFFSNEQVDIYHLQLSTRRGREPYSSAGIVRSISIQENTNTSPIPIGFFPDIEFNARIPVEITTGQAVRVSGTVFDPTLSMIALTFFQKNLDFRLIHRAPVIDGKFNKTIFFAHKTAGVYDLELWRYRGSRQGAAAQDVFRPVNVMRGAGTAYFPYDYFEGVIITSRMPVVFSPGQKLRIAGAVSDPSVSDIEFQFQFQFPSGYPGPSPGTTEASFKAAISYKQFSIPVDFPSQLHPGDYWLDVFLHRRDNRSRGPRTFGPITILPSPDFDGNGTVDLADFRVFSGAFGRPSAAWIFRYDLNGDGTVDFADFLIFARAFGQ